MYLSPYNVSDSMLRAGHTKFSKGKKSLTSWSLESGGRDGQEAQSNVIITGWLWWRTTQRAWWGITAGTRDGQLGKASLGRGNLSGNIKEGKEPGRTGAGGSFPSRRSKKWPWWSGKGTGCGARRRRRGRAEHDPKVLGKSEDFITVCGEATAWGRGVCGLVGRIKTR